MSGVNNSEQARAPRTAQMSAVRVPKSPSVRTGACTYRLPVPVLAFVTNVTSDLLRCHEHNKILAVAPRL